jgi:hypothetical protein
VIAGLNATKAAPVINASFIFNGTGFLAIFFVVLIVAKRPP